MCAFYVAFLSSHALKALLCALSGGQFLSKVRVIRVDDIIDIDELAADFWSLGGFVSFDLWQ